MQLFLQLFQHFRFLCQLFLYLSSHHPRLSDTCCYAIFRYENFVIQLLFLQSKSLHRLLNLEYFRHHFIQLFSLLIILFLNFITLSLTQFILFIPHPIFRCYIFNCLLFSTYRNLIVFLIFFKLLKILHINL